MSLESALALIESVKDYSVLFVGDDIIDEYHYVRPLGKSSKEYMIATAFISKEAFDGGTQAASNHLRTFCKTVEVRKSPTAVHKVRFVDKATGRKVFECQHDERIEVNSYLDGTFDAVVVQDFGHGRVTGEMIKKLCAMPFVAVNAQTNAANFGFNLITKYQRADYIVIDELEARLAAGDRDGHIEDVMQKLAHGRCERFVVTRGTHGAYGYDNGKFYRQPAFTDRVVDTMGAGDAFFAVTAPMAKNGEMGDLLLIGCAAGALKCGIVGHREAVTKEALIGYLKANAG